jgi:hypothetical protein
MIAADGTVASPVMSGAQPLLALAGWQPPTKTAPQDAEPIPDTAVLLPVDDITTSDIDDQLMVYSAATSETLLLNGTAAYVWESFDGSRTIEDVSRDVSEDFGVPYETALADVREITTSLRGYGLLAVSAVSAP